jgi:hypothetical protein
MTTMAYRGDDLDLRTPQSHSSPADHGSWRDDNGTTRGRIHHGGVLNGPIMVDETVLACCNHAYDVALAHGAPDVRLEHFLHALTRIDAAAEALEARGVRVAALRREIATVIASEIPVSSSKTAGSPRRAQELEDVLRLAASHAARRDEAASIDDVVHVILDEEPDLPGLSLLTRRTARRSMDSLPTPARSSYTEGRNYLFDPGRPSRYRLTQPAYGQENGNGHGAGGIGRIDALEHAINGLIGDISADRKAMGGALQDLQREAIAQRDELIDGFNALNQAVHSARGQSVDLTPLNERVVSLGRETGSKLQALETHMERLRHAPPVDLGAISKRLEAIEDVITARSEDHSAQIAERLAKLEDALGKAQARTTEQHDGVLRELSQVSSRFSGALIPVAEKVERQRAEFATMLQPVSERLERQRTDITNAILTPLADGIGRLEKLSQAADSNEVRTGQVLTAVGDRLTRLEKSLAEWSQHTVNAAGAHSKELGEVEDVLVKLSDSQRLASGTLSAWRQEGTSVLGTLLKRVETVEQHTMRANSVLEQLSILVERMHQVTAQRYLKRNRIKYWLFGTDDWVSASWPSQAGKVAEVMDRDRNPIA